MLNLFIVTKSPNNKFKVVIFSFSLLYYHFNTYFPLTTQNTVVRALLCIFLFILLFCVILIIIGKKNSRPLKDFHIGEKSSILDSKTLKPAVVKKRSFIVKTENGKTCRRNLQHFHQIADSNGTDDTMLMSDGEEENSIEQELFVKFIVKREEVDMDPCRSKHTTSR